MNYIDELAQRIAAQIDPSDLPDEDTVGLLRLYAVLASVKGIQVTRSDVHDAWVAWRSEKRPDHKSNVPFDQLSEEVQAMDEPFARAIREVARQP